MKSVIAVSALVGAALLGPGRDLSLHRSHAPDIHPGPVAGAMAHPTLHEAQSRCRYEAERTLTVSAPSDGRLRLDAGSGSL